MRKPEAQEAEWKVESHTAGKRLYLNSLYSSMLIFEKIVEITSMAPLRFLRYFPVERIFW